MDYRDERDALRGRVENLEQDLDVAKKEIDAHRGDDRRQRIADIERQMADARRALDRLGAELGALKGEAGRAKRGGRSNARIAAYVLTGAIAIPLGMFVMSRSQPPQVVVVTAPLRPVAPPPPPIETVPVEPPAAKAPAPRSVIAGWDGRVTRASGLPLAVGRACRVEAVLGTDGEKIQATKLDVTCGGKEIYRSTDKLEGMSMWSSRVVEEAGAPTGTNVYQLAYNDKGTRTGERNEVTLDTSARVGTVWRDTAPAFRVDFSLEPKSAPVQADALLDRAR